jgi:hypothetical protein
MEQDETFAKAARFQRPHKRKEEHIVELLPKYVGRRLFVDDICLPIDTDENFSYDSDDDSEQYCTVERTRLDVDSHEPDPQHLFSSKIRKHRKIGSAAFKAFLQHGRPPANTVLVEWFNGIVELLPAGELSLVYRKISRGQEVKVQGQPDMTGVVISKQCRYDLVPIPQFRRRTAIAYIPDAYQQWIVRDVPAEQLWTGIHPDAGGIVVYQGWVGILDGADDNLTIRLRNKSVIEVKSNPGVEIDDKTREEGREIGLTVSLCQPELQDLRLVSGRLDSRVNPRGEILSIQGRTVRVDWLKRRDDAPGSFPVPHMYPMPMLECDKFEGGEAMVYDERVEPSTETRKIFKYPGSYEFEFQQRVKFIDRDSAIERYANVNKVDANSSEI